MLLCLLPLGTLGTVACGDGTDAASPSSTGEAAGSDQVGDRSAPLELTPRVDPVGMGDIHDTLRVTRLDFDAEIYVLPDGIEAVPGQAAIRFRFANGVASTELLGDGLRLARSGSYKVLVRVHPSAGGSSVVLGGEYLPEPEALEKPDQEPAPLPADEPAPLPADDEEPAPLPADDEEPAPLPADEEPAPIPADEPAPLPADEGEDGDVPNAEPAPLPADEGADGREKPEDWEDGDGETMGDPVFVRSSRPFEFYAGTVDVAAGSTELVVTWDVRNWLRALLAEPLGLPVDGTIEDANGTGFSDVPTDFNVRTR